MRSVDPCCCRLEDNLSLDPGGLIAERRDKGARRRRLMMVKQLCRFRFRALLSSSSADAEFSLQRLLRACLRELMPHGIRPLLALFYSIRARPTIENVSSKLSATGSERFEQGRRNQRASACELISSIGAPHQRACSSTSQLVAGGKRKKTSPNLFSTSSSPLSLNTGPFPSSSSSSSS